MVVDRVGALVAPALLMQSEGVKWETEPDWRGGKDEWRSDEN